MKYSKQREIVLNLLQNTKAHPNAEKVYSMLKSQFSEISISTVYRNLSQLAGAGAIQRIRMDDGVDRFDADTKPHYHVCCQSCGSLIDLEMPVFENLEQIVAEETGITPISHDIRFTGICPECSKNNNS